ncbi:hypothetical protein SAMN05216251_10545 [Actinacidiphila alni]|uniref:Uncharacterized protein n=1 Tax=Actinacidiphila alni TaxID=380248 RepID=A0A1I2D2A3_9ACTN|nr:hypothetical protein [Actinacidiphila alni]SFE74658.1 hypothetical protein SAMN05216251_10545 [Actinacidiphila alni]
MFDHLEIAVLPPGPRYPPQVRLLVNGEDVLDPAVGPDGRGPLAADLWPPHGPGPLAATDVPRRVELGAPACTGGGCGFLTVVVHRIDTVVQWYDWQPPDHMTRPLACDFDAAQYDTALARAAVDPWWRVYER